MAVTFVTSNGGGSTRADSYWAGFRMTANNNLTVTALGRWVTSGNTQTHALNLLDSSGNLLGQATVNTSGQPANTYVFQSLGPVNLSKGSTYYLLSQEGAGDSWCDSQIYTSTSDGSITGGTYSGSGTGVPTVQAGAGVAYVPVNFQYALASHQPPDPTPSGLVEEPSEGTQQAN